VDHTSIEILAMSEYEGGTFRCKVCGREFLTKNEGDRHHKEIHANEGIDIGE
jgi:hypothetical protein